MLVRLIRNFVRDRRGNIAILSTVMITSLVGVSGLVAEFGNGLLNRMQDQRIADAAAMGGGTVYNSTASTSAMTAAVNNIATLNGIPTSDISAQVVSSPSGDGNQAVQVTVATSVPLVLSRVLWSQNTLPINVSSYAELEAGAPGCIMALSSSGSGITMGGGTAITAAQCAVTSNTSVSVPCGDYITSKQVMYDTTISQPCNGIQAPTGGTLTISKGVSTDPFASDSYITSATARLSTVGAISSPSVTTQTAGTAVSFGYTQSTTQSQLSADGCSGTFSGSTWTVTCVGSSSFHFGAISLAGGISVNFNTSGSSLNTYDFSGPISNAGSALTFGPGTFNITGGISSGGGTTTTFGSSSYSSTYNITASSSSCNGPTNYSICNGSGSTMTFLGTSTFTLAGGVYNPGGSTLLLGSGTSNSYNIGKMSTGDSVYVGGGATTTLADATGTGDLFQLAGNLNDGGGGSCLTVPAATQHDINGSLLMSGGVKLGSGVYTIYGAAQMGANGGGTVTCGGTTIGLYGNGVTLVIGANNIPSNGSCTGSYAFCVANGYNNTTLVAPSSGNTEGLAVIGPTSTSNTAGVLFTEGSSSQSISGAFYFPHGAITMDGAATVGNGSSQCLMLIGSQVTMNGGTAIASTCNINGYSGSGSSGTVALVQ
jgi:Flp pilus assembly protein TadG